MKWLYTLSLFLIYGSFACAQGTLRGRITDDKNQPLPGATVRLSMMDTDVKVSVTDTGGRFAFNHLPTGNYLLKISLISYQPITRTIGANAVDTDAGTYILLPSATQLREIAILASTPLIEKQIDKTVVNVDQNITYMGSNALEMLKKLPGVQVGSDGQITLNGKSGVNVMIDGKSTFLSATDLASLLTNTPSSDMQKVEIMTNPSAKYDAGGTGGIINLVRKKNNKPGLNGSVTASLGQGYYGRYNTSLVLNYKTRSYNLYLNNSYGYNKGYSLSNVTGDILNNGALASEQVSTNMGITVNKALSSSAGLDLYLSRKTTLTLTGSIANRRYSNELTSVMSFADSNRRQTGSENFRALNADKPLNFSTGVQLQYKPDTTGRSWSAGMDYANFQYRPGQFNTGLNFDASGGLSNQDNVFIDESRTLHIFGARADYAQPFRGEGKWEAGIKTSYVKTDNNNIYYNQSGGQNIPDPALSDHNLTSENINAAYVNFNKAFGKLSLQAGLRAEQTIMTGQQAGANITVDQNYFQLFPTLFLSDKLNDQNSLNFQFGRRVSRPDYHELVPFRRPLSATLYFEGNPDLKPDINWHSELTWAWRNTLFLTAAYDVDRDYLRTLLYLDPNQTTITRKPTNVQGAKSWNVDLSFNKEIAKWLTTNTTATIYQNLFNGSAGGFSLDDPGFATIDLVTSNSFQLSNQLSAEADLEYESKRQFVGSIFGAYATLNLAIKQKLFNGGGSITVNGTNVLNTDSRDVSDRYLNLYQAGRGLIYSRAVILTFNYHFGGKLARSQSKSGSEEEQKRAGN